MANNTYLASNLTHLCQLRGLPVSVVARDLRMSPTALLKLSRGESEARLSTLVRIAQYFGVDHLALGAVDLTAPGALEAASAGGAVPQASVFEPRPVVDSPAEPQTKPAPERAREGVPVVTCEKALELKGTGGGVKEGKDVIEWLPPLPDHRFENASLLAVKAPSATMSPSIRQGDYLYLRSSIANDLDPLATVLADVGSGESHVFSLGTIVAKSSAEWLIVGTNPLTGLDPRPVREVVGIVVAVLSFR